MNLYVHIPFCKQKCNYCAFHSQVIAPEHGEGGWDKYTDEILQQLKILNSKLITHNSKNIVFRTIFFGGGTPSLMPVKYFEEIRKAIDLAPDAEWTVEANPGTLRSYDLLALKDLGVNRLSVGMQSFDDDILSWMGRIHSARDALDLIESAAAIGLRVSADFIYGFSGCNVGALCENINKLPIEHASLYELSIEQGSKFASSNTSNFLSFPRARKVAGAKMIKNDEELTRDYETIQTTLRLPRYEISNYGEPCRHNANVWAGEEYIGIGESAAGRILIDGAWYETKITNGEIVMNKLSFMERAMEMVITGLRTVHGVDISMLPANIINWDFVNDNPELFNPWPGRGKTHLKLSDKGFLLLDALLPKIVL